MSIGQEFVISLFIQLLILAFFVGIYVATIKFMDAQIKELKEEMKRYNNVLERLIITEQSTKSAHHRIDEWEDRFNK
jgi:cell division protein FtsL